MKTFLDELPEELKLLILQFLGAGDTPQWPRNSHEPSLETYDLSVKPSPTPLKALSAVSSGWRRMTTPFLFKALKIPLEDLFRAIPDGADPATSMALISRVLSAVPERFPLHIPLKQWTQHLTLYVAGGQETFMHHVLRPWIDHFWQDIFVFFDPLRLSIVAPPKILAELVSCPANMDDAWAFNIPYQRIDLYNTEHWRRKTPRIALQKFAFGIAPSLIPTQRSSDCNEPVIDLNLTGREEELKHNPLIGKVWDVMAFNAGSSFPNYGTYHYHDRCPPCIIQPDFWPLARTFDNLKHFDYVAVFPHLTQFRKTAAAICRMTRLETLSLELVPNPSSTLLNDLDRIARGNTNLRDCWAEVEKCYALMIGTMMNRAELGVLRRLIAFTSHDCHMPFMRNELKQIFERGASREWSQWSMLTWSASML